MTWPPNNQPTGGKSDSTPMATDHPTEHNAIKDTLDDIITGVLPLSGGTLDPGAQIKARGTNATAPAYSFAANPGVGMYLANGADGIVGLSGELWVSQRLRAPALLIDGNIEAGTIYGTLSGSIAHDTHVTGNLIIDNVLGLPSLLGAGPSSQHPNICLDAAGWVRRSNWTPSRMAFGITEGIDTADVLERAETATLPPEIETDADGNQTNPAEIETHDTVQLFEVVTALLAKVKELSGRLEALET